jgi:hypothetical protein
MDHGQSETGAAVLIILSLGAIASLMISVFACDPPFMYECRARKRHVDYYLGA